MPVAIDMALFLAAKYNSLEKIIELIGKGGNLDAIDFSSGQTPLIVAIKNQDLGIIKGLIDLGANPNAPTFHEYAPIHAAVETSSLGVLKLLLETNQIDVNAPCFHENSASWLTPLDIAKMQKSDGIIDALLGYNAKTCQQLTDEYNEQLKNSLRNKPIL